MNNRKRNAQIKFRVTEEERGLIKEKMKQVPTSNMEVKYFVYYENLKIKNRIKIVYKIYRTTTYTTINPNKNEQIAIKIYFKILSSLLALFFIISDELSSISLLKLLLSFDFLLQIFYLLI